MLFEAVSSVYSLPRLSHPLVLCCYRWAGKRIHVSWIWKRRNVVHGPDLVERFCKVWHYNRCKSMLICVPRGGIWTKNSVLCVDDDKCACLVLVPDHGRDRLICKLKWVHGIFTKVQLMPSVATTVLCFVVLSLLMCYFAFKSNVCLVCVDANLCVVCADACLRWVRCCCCWQWEEHEVVERVSVSWYWFCYARESYFATSMSTVRYAVAPDWQCFAQIFWDTRHNTITHTGRMSVFDVTDPGWRIALPLSYVVFWQDRNKTYPRGTISQIFWHIVLKLNQTHQYRHYWYPR